MYVPSPLVATSVIEGTRYRLNICDASVTVEMSRPERMMRATGTGRRRVNEAAAK
jgi:hypothetical protein